MTIEIDANVKTQIQSRRDRQLPLGSPSSVGDTAFRLLFEQHPHPAWLFDSKALRLLAVNEAAARTCGYTRQEFEKMTLKDLQHLWEGLDVFRADLEDVLGEPSAPRRWHLRKKDGTTADVEVRSHQLTFSGREARLVVASDVARSEHPSEELQETQARYRDLLDHANDIVFTTDLRGKLTSLNRAGEVATGFSSKDAVGMDVAEILGPRSVELAHHMRDGKLTDSAERTYEIEIARKDGELITLAARMSFTTRCGKPTGIRGIARDITERKQLEDRLRQYQKMEALGRLAGGVAHDFNNLLGVIIGYSEILADRLDAQDPLREFAGEALKAGRQAASLTQQLLAFSRKQVLRPKVLDLNASVTGMEQLLRRLLREDINLNFKLSPDLGRVKADPGQIQQVVMNLAVNARDAMPQGGELTIETSNEDREESYTRQDPFVAAGRYVLLTVTDTGVGMDEKTRTRVFEPFFTTKQLGNGTGLGLATVYGIVKQSGGYLSVQSQLGKGCTFKVFLPRVDEGERDSSLDKKAEARVLTGNETILLVEDADAFRKLVRMLLETSGYTVLDARTGADAARIAAKHKGSIDLLLSDIVMPQIDGYQLSDHLRFFRPEMKVLFMSGYAAPKASIQVKSKIGARVLPKPFCKDVLLLAVRRMLDDSPRRDNSHVTEGSVMGLIHNCFD